MYTCDVRVCGRRNTKEYTIRYIMEKLEIMNQRLTEVIGKYEEKLHINDELHQELLFLNHKLLRK